MSLVGLLNDSSQMRTSDDDIEYNITFPSAPKDTGLPRVKKAMELRVMNDELEPIVFLLGWVGCKDKILAKYSLIYEDAGCITIRYIYPTQKVFSQDPSDSKNLQETAEKLFLLLDDYDLKHHPILVHSFSNGGYFVYRYLADIFYVSDINMLGVVIDSAPAKLELKSASRVISAITPNRFVAFFYLIALTIFFVMLKIKYSLGLSKNKNLYEYMQEIHYHSWPHLFLYSSADEIVPRDNVEEMARSRRLNGAMLVAKFDFKSSSHCKHFGAFPQLYREKCLKFMDDCMRMFNVDAINSEGDFDSKSSFTS